MAEDLMKLTKAELIKMIGVIKEGKKKKPGQNYPIQPETPFDQMGKLEYCRWRVRLVTWRIENDELPRTSAYKDSEKRYRVKMMKEFCEWFDILKKEDHVEAEKFQKLYDQYVKGIVKEEKEIPVIEKLELNTSGR